MWLFGHTNPWSWQGPTSHFISTEECPNRIFQQPGHPIRCIDVPTDLNKSSLVLKFIAVVNDHLGTKGMPRLPSNPRPTAEWKGSTEQSSHAPEFTVQRKTQLLSAMCMHWHTNTARRSTLRRLRHISAWNCLAATWFNHWNLCPCDSK